MDYDKILNGIQIAKSQGYSDADISEFLKSKGIKIEDVQKAYASKQPKSQEGGFLQNIIQGATHLPLAFASTLKSLGADATSFYNAAESGFKTMDFSEGDKIRQEGADYGYLGKVKPIGGDINNQTFGGLAKNVGGFALESGIDAATLGAGSSLTKAGVGGLKEFGQVAGKNAVIGAGYGASQSLENDDSFVQILLNTVLGGTAGSVLGTAGHYALPAIAKGASKVATNIADEGLVKGIDKTIVGGIKDVEQQVPSGNYLNIGMNEGTTNVKMSSRQIISNLPKDVEVLGSKIIKGETEDSLSLQLSRPLTDSEMSKLLSATKQKAIPQFSNGKGTMHGSKEWGEFNPDYFYGLDGKPLSSTKSKLTEQVPQDFAKTFTRGTEEYDTILQNAQEGIPELKNATPEQQDAFMKELLAKSDKLKVKETGNKKAVTTEDVVKSIGEDIKQAAEEGTKIVRESKQNFKDNEIVRAINQRAIDNKKQGLLIDSEEIDKALQKRIANFKLGEVRTDEQLLNLKRNIDLSSRFTSSTEESATKEADAIIKQVIDEKLRAKHPGLESTDKIIHEKMNALEAFGKKDMIKPGSSFGENIAGTVASILSAPQGLIVSYSARNLAKKGFNLLFPAAEGALKGIQEAAPKAVGALQQLIDAGVDEDLAHALLREKSSFGKPTAETTLKVIQQLQQFGEKEATKATEESAQKVADSKSLVKIIRGLGTDVEAIAEELANEGYEVTKEQAKTFANLNKNTTSKAITPYLEKLGRLTLKG